MKISAVTIPLLLRIIRKASLKRMWNFILVFTSYYCSRILRNPIQWGLPVSISIEPTTACNLRCPQCPSGLRSFQRPTGHLSLESYNHWMVDLYPQLWFLNFYFQGEPFLHPEICKAIRQAQQAGVFTSTSTNGHFLTTTLSEEIVLSGLDQLIISVDGTSQDTYQQYRIGGQLEKVLQGIKHLVEAKTKYNSQTPYIIFQFLVVKNNVHQMMDARKLSKELGCNEIRFKTAQIYEYAGGSALIPESEVYSRYQKQKDGRYKIKNKLMNHCWRLWNAPVITWDGRVVPCCFDKDAQHVMGNVQSEGFVQIWKNKSYAKFRLKLLKSRKNIEICKNCTEGTKVWI